MAMDIEKILELMPHRYPMLLVDRIIEVESEKRIVGLKNVTFNEAFFQGHFPDDPVMPGVMILEAMAQVGCLFILAGLDDREEKLVYFAGIDNARFRRPVRPGDQLRLEITALKIRSKTCKMRGEAYVGDELAAEAEFMSMLVPRKGRAEKKSPS
ncbi:MAG: 3-hydroxyacyl-ACP dehydratase FabZ [Acidobacteriota bacterium]|nr:MAG: 3-hydroxyacyl-ACP dehydratase FabZ [Acidobacteriota bacterium]